MQRKREAIDVRNIRRGHAARMAKGELVAVQVLPEGCTETEFGWRLPIASTKTYECFVEHFAPSITTSTFSSKGKSRSVYVTEGTLFVVHAAGEVQEVGTGTSITLEPGSEYAFSTGPTPCRVMITQDAKYTWGLKKDLKRLKVNKATMFKSPGTRTGSRNKKTIQALEAKRGMKKESSQGSVNIEDFVRPGDAGVNAKPITNFD